MKNRQILFAAVCAAGLGAAPAVSAFTVALDGPTNVHTGDDVTFSVNFSGVETTADVVLFHDIFVAFDNTVLSYKAVDFSFASIVSPANQGDPLYQDAITDGTEGNYKAPPNDWTYAGVNYGDGSVRVFQQTDFTGPPYDGLLNGAGDWDGQLPDFTAFALTFEVIAEPTLTSIIALIDDTSYTEFGTTGQHYYDYKIGSDDNPWYPPSVVTATFNVVDVPVPAPLALLGLGLGLLGAARRLA